MAAKKRAKPAKKSVDLTLLIIGDPVKSPLRPIFVIPAKAGIQIYMFLVPCFRRDNVWAPAPRSPGDKFCRSDGLSGFLREDH
jgi:hypothetical protein